MRQGSWGILYSNDKKEPQIINHTANLNYLVDLQRAFFIWGLGNTTKSAHLLACRCFSEAQSLKTATPTSFKDLCPKACLKAEPTQGVIESLKFRQLRKVHFYAFLLLFDKGNFFLNQRAEKQKISFQVLKQTMKIFVAVFKDI